MLKMEVQILSKKMIYPSTPTPQHLRNLKISSMDQITSPTYVAIIFYYPATSSDDNETENVERKKQLEKSLSETLSVFYPLAGRYFKVNLSIDCNNQGVEYLEAQVNTHLAQILYGELKVEQLNHFVPFVMESGTSPLVAIQINMFECGGLAIGLLISHRIADGVTMAAFMNVWATASRGGIAEVIRPSFDLASLFPPKEISGIKFAGRPRNMGGNKVVTRRFVFNGAAISSLKAIVKASACDSAIKHQPSRVEVVTALIWKTLIRVAEAKHGHLRGSLLSHAVNMRGKTVLPIPENSCGNLITQTIARFSADKSKMELHHLVGLVSDAIRNAIADCAKPLNGDELLLKVTNTSREVTEESDKGEVDVHMFSSWCRFPIYETDFGWGKPHWVSNIHIPVEMVMLIDTKYDDGIEAWVSLKEKDMLHFQEDQDIVAFALLPK